jgi:hypothetical protein
MQLSTLPVQVGINGLDPEVLDKLYAAGLAQVGIKMV